MRILNSIHELNNLPILQVVRLPKKENSIKTDTKQGLFEMELSEFNAQNNALKMRLRAKILGQKNKRQL